MRSASPKQRAYFCAADVKCVAELGHLRKGEIRALRSQAVSAARAVDVEKHAEFETDVANIAQLAGGVEGPQLCGLREIDHAGLHHVLVGFVLIMAFAEFPDASGGQLAAAVGQRQHLVTSGLDSAAFVDGDMSCVGADNALMGSESRCDQRQIGLGSSRDEVDVSLRRLTELFQQPGGSVAVGILSVAAGLLHISLLEHLQNVGMRSLGVVAVKVYHKINLSFLS